MKIDFHGLDGMGGPMYVGTGCFHRREILSGKSLYDGKRIDWNMVNDHKETTLENTNEEIKKLATCTFETDTEWGKEVLLVCFQFLIPSQPNTTRPILINTKIIHRDTLPHLGQCYMISLEVYHHRNSAT